VLEIELPRRVKNPPVKIQVRSEAPESQVPENQVQEN
jgi:hypothetical protein